MAVQDIVMTAIAVDRLTSMAQPLRYNNSILVRVVLNQRVLDVQVIVMAAIAVDRFTSLAQPLRYNNLITHQSVERYILMFWVYSGAVGLVPLVYTQCFNRGPLAGCAFMSVIDKPVRVFLFSFVYGPCAIIVLGECTSNCLTSAVGG